MPGVVGIHAVVFASDRHDRVLCDAHGFLHLAIALANATTSGLKER